MKIADLNFDKVFLINLEHNRERLERSEKFLQNWHLTYERFDAVYAKNMGIRHIDGKFTQGMVGCFLSHFFIFHQAVREGWETILVLEDDFEPVPGFDHLFAEAWKQVPEDWHFIWLGWTFHKGTDQSKVVRINDYWIKAPSLWGTQAYIVRGREVIREIYKDLKTMHEQIDLQLIGRSLTGICHYCIFPSAVGQVGDGTDVQDHKPQIQVIDGF